MRFFDYGRNYGIVYDVEAQPICWFSGMTWANYTDNFMTGRTTGVRPTVTPTSSVWLTV
jgi:predicted porin